VREASFVVPMEIPTNPRARYIFKSYLIALLPQIGTFGKDGEKVGLGFVWETQTGLGESGLNTLSRRMQRALRVSGILSRLADTYFLEQRINYIRDGDPSVTFRLKEESA
jgi:hypothetical protein